MSEKAPIADLELGQRSRSTSNSNNRVHSLHHGSHLDDHGVHIDHEHDRADSVEGHSNDSSETIDIDNKEHENGDLRDVGDEKDENGDLRDVPSLEVINGMMNEHDHDQDDKERRKTLSRQSTKKSNQMSDPTLVSSLLKLSHLK
jgi:hypothetical protein